MAQMFRGARSIQYFLWHGDDLPEQGTRAINRYGTTRAVKGGCSILIPFSYCFSQNSSRARGEE